MHPPRSLAVSSNLTHVVFPMFDRMTQLDFAAPHLAFSLVPDARVTVASLGGRDIKTDTGVTFTELADLQHVATCDVLCVPGGSGTNVAMLDEDFMREIRRLARTAKYHTSVCTGALILGAAGLLRGKRATTYWAERDVLKKFGSIVEDSRVVRDGTLITGGGVTAGLDFALVAIAEIFGRRIAESVQLGMEYAPAPPFDAGRPECLPAEVVDQVRNGLSALLAADHAAVEEAVRRLQAA
jgi:putative intracellular protease/amidase